MPHLQRLDMACRRIDQHLEPLASTRCGIGGPDILQRQRNGGGRRERIARSHRRKLPARRGASGNLARTPMCQEAWYRQIEPVPIVAVLTDERTKVSKTAQMRKTAQPGFERRQPERQRCPHRNAERPDPPFIHPRPAGEQIEGPGKIRQHVAEQCRALPEVALGNEIFGLARPLTETAKIDGKRHHTLPGKRMGIGFGLKRRTPDQKFIRADLITTAMCVTVENSGQAGPRPRRPSDEAAHGDAIPAFKVEALAL